MSNSTNQYEDDSSNNHKARQKPQRSLVSAENEKPKRVARATNRTRVHTTLEVSLSERSGQSVNFLRNLGGLGVRRGANKNSDCASGTVEASSKRLVNGGAQYLFDDEILELLLFDVPSVSNASCLADRLLREFGDLNHVLAASDYRIRKIDDVTQQVLIRLAAIKEISLRMAREKVVNEEVISCTRDLLLYCRTLMAYKSKEQFRVFYLNKKNAIIADEEQAEGTIDHVPVYPREIAKRTLELDASATILVHNHPSGDPTPSHEDLAMTKSVVEACQAIGVIVHDHIIIGKSQEFSFRSNGLL